MTDGTQRTLARVSCASATQTLAWAAATISGRASESRRAVARLIGKRRSVDSSGAGFSFRSTARGEDGPSTTGRPGRRSGRRWRRQGLGAAQVLHRRRSAQGLGRRGELLAAARVTASAGRSGPRRRTG